MICCCKSYNCETGHMNTLTHTHARQKSVLRCYLLDNTYCTPKYYKLELISDMVVVGLSTVDDYDVNNVDSYEEYI